MIKKTKVEPVYKATANGETLDLIPLNHLMKNIGVHAGIVSTNGIVINQMNQDGSIGELLATITSYGHVHILIKKLDPNVINVNAFYTYINALVHHNKVYFGMATELQDTPNKDDIRDTILALNTYGGYVRKNALTFENNGISIKYMDNSDDNADPTIVVEFFSDGTSKINTSVDGWSNIPTTVHAQRPWEIPERFATLLGDLSQTTP